MKKIVLGLVAALSLASASAQTTPTLTPLVVVPCAATSAVFTAMINQATPGDTKKYVPVCLALAAVAKTYQDSDDQS